jgi:putative transposase
MISATAPSRQRPYGTARVCRIWGVSRATLDRHRTADGAANDARPPRRRGPVGACGATDLLAAIQAVLEASPFLGEGTRTVWARLRVQGIRTAARRVRRLRKEHGLLAPHRPASRLAPPHDGPIVTGRVDEVWGPDMTQTVTPAEGRA